MHKVHIGCLEVFPPSLSVALMSRYQAGHMKEFAEANEAHIAVDVARGELFCFACKNYVR